jgi:hypothetical protein
MATTDQTFTCNDCGTTGSLQWMQDHPCGDVQSVNEFGGRCEDYPCCGHQPGECAPQERFTKAYWQDRYDSLSPEDRDEVDMYGWPDEEERW